MKPPKPVAMTAHAERRAMLALVLAFAFVVQMLAPALATAAPTPDGGVTICTTMGLQTLGADLNPGDAPEGPHHCQHCVCPAPLSPADPLMSATRVVYATGVAPVADTPRGLRPQARAPPRPPGQGPPVPNA
ncbi:DUF2946 family protein [Phenylobacterium sp. SCN 70-31]|uniref:DUF2946 family protein n=1 Tax=Phenylobacterium sp. SCN 70-31 TaxID=1660129 RepID=UPI0025FA5AEB|nr:DUF2946 family protein [Phenylobacterium sp. SCN 70-31]